MKKLIALMGFVALSLASYAGGYTVGSTASDFKLKNVDGEYVSLADYPNAKAL
jgi:hypothetical protein